MITKSKPEVYGIVQTIIQDALKIPDGSIAPDANLTKEYGADSLFATQLLMALEEKFDIEIPDEDIPLFFTMQDIVDYVINQLSNDEGVLCSPLVSIQLASKDWEFKAAYGLRFGKVGVPQFNLESPDSNQFRDDQDRKGSLLLIAKADDDQVVGTLSVVRRCDGPFILDDLYDWQLLSRQLQLSVDEIHETTGLIARGCVSPDYQHTGTFKGLLQSAENHALNSKCKFLIGVVVNQHSSMNILKSLGYSEYLKAPHMGGIGTRLIKALDIHK